MDEPQLQEVDPKPELSDNEDVPFVQRLEQSIGKFIIGLSGDLENTEMIDDEPDGASDISTSQAPRRVFLRTLTLEFADTPARLTISQDEDVSTGPGSSGHGGHSELQRDLANFRAALEGVEGGGASPANTPGTIEHWLERYYKSDEEFLFAIAEAMRVEYKAIVEAGFAADRQSGPARRLADDTRTCVGEYREYAELRVAALNHALREIPREKVRLHVCWGSFHGPHKTTSR